MIYAWGFDAVAVIAFLLSYYSFRRDRVAAGERLLFIAYAFVLMCYFVALREHGVL
jgi:hypothetical protein